MRLAMTDGDTICAIRSRNDNKIANLKANFATIAPKI